MSPLLLVGIFLVGVASGDVKHVLDGSARTPLNVDAHAINLLEVADEDGVINNQQKRAYGGNPFFNGQFAAHQDDAHVQTNPEKLDLSNNPFFNSGIQTGQFHAGSSPLGQRCEGSGHICVRKAECDNGIINNDGFGVIEVRGNVAFCNPKTEVCCRYKNHDFVTAGKSSVPGSAVKSSGQIFTEPKLTVSNLGETGADINSIGSSTSKPTRDAPFSGSTIDYSNTHFGDDVRFASTIRGPAYLPPVDKPRCDPPRQLINGQCQQPPKPFPSEPPPTVDCNPPQQYVNGRCRLVCTGNTYEQNGRCVPCTPPQQFINGRCQLVCTGNTYEQNGRCVPRPTPPTPTPQQPQCYPPQQLINGRCQLVCTGNTYEQNGRCVPKTIPPPPPPPPQPQCYPPQQLVNGRCQLVCSGNTYEQNGRCVPRPTPPPPPPPQPQCYPPQQLINGRCQLVCSGNTYEQNGRCVPKPTPPPPPPPPQPQCYPPQQLVNGRCQIVCSGNTYEQNGRCVPKPTPPPPPPPQPQCYPPQQLVNGQCQLVCTGNTYEQNGRCVPKPTPPPPPPPQPQCYPPQQLINGRCQLVCTGNTYEQNGRCVPRPTPPPPPPPQPQCSPPQQLINGRCQLVCTGNTYEQNGRCVSKPTPPPPPPPQPQCYPPQQLVNGRCQIVCSGNTYEQNGRCVPRPTPPPPPPPQPQCYPPEQLINGHCQLVCTGNTYEQNGRCIPRGTPPPPPPPPQPQCYPPQQLVNGRCQLVCSGNTYEQNGRCVPRPTPPPPPPPQPQCYPPQQLINGRCQLVCTGNTYEQNGRCVPRTSPPPPPPPQPQCYPPQQFVNGRCQLVCSGNTYEQNGRCVPRPTPPPPPPQCDDNSYFANGRCIPKVTPPPTDTTNGYLPPQKCNYNEILQNGICVPKPPVCTGNTILQNGVCVPQQPSCGPGTYPQNGICVPIPTRPPPTPTGPPGYHYPKPTPSFNYPSPTPSSSNEVTSITEFPHEATDETDQRPTYVTKPRPPTRRPPPIKPDNTPDAGNNIPEIINPNPPSPPLPGCAAALKCVQEIYCTAEGFVSPVPVVFSEQDANNRVPLTDCADQESGTTGKCCRDPDYKDPWPSANLVNGIDNGAYREDPSLGQYVGDKSRPTRSNPGTAYSQGETTCGVRHYDGQPRGPGSLDAHFSEMPWQAMILRDSNRSLLCGGAIIRRNVVLTSAHCVEGLDANDVLIKGGEWKLGIDEEPLPFQIVKVKKIVLHPNYNKDILHDDTALLLLQEKLRPAKNIDTICLPGPNDKPAGNCLVTGWGKKILQIHLKGAIMRQIEVQAFDGQQCTETLQTTHPEFIDRVGQNTFCAQSNADQCKVDHGSAIACTTDNQHYTLAGVFSWDTGCKQNDQVGGYILPDIEWINSVISKRAK